MNNPLGVSPSKGNQGTLVKGIRTNQGTTRGKEKIF